MKTIKTAVDFEVLSDQDKDRVIDFFSTQGRLRVNLVYIFSLLFLFIFIPALNMIFVYYSWLGYFLMIVGCGLIYTILRRYDWLEDFQKMNESKKILALQGIDIAGSKITSLPEEVKSYEKMVLVLRFMACLAVGVLFFITYVGYKMGN